MGQAVDALSQALISPEIIKRLRAGEKAYSVYGDDPVKAIEQQLLGTLRGHITITGAE